MPKNATIYLTDAAVSGTAAYTVPKDTEAQEERYQYKNYMYVKVYCVRCSSHITCITSITVGIYMHIQRNNIEKSQNGHLVLDAGGDSSGCLQRSMGEVPKKAMDAFGTLSDFTQMTCLLQC